MGLVEGTSAKELYQLLEQLQVDVTALKKKKTPHMALATLYLDLQDSKISEPPKARLPDLD